MKAKDTFFRKTALSLAILLLVEAFFPAFALALTSGPAQPEFQGFQQVGASDMVDLFSGDFNYNIPLGEIGGYPLNLVYNSNPRMDEEASWTGLGWTLNPGAINRQMRGLPDDFKGDALEKEFNIAPDETVGMTVGPNFELFGKGFKLGFNKGLVYNSRRGFEVKSGVNFSPSVALGQSNKNLTANLGLSFAPSSGLQINSSFGIGKKYKESIARQNSLSAGFNSRTGVRALTFQLGFNQGNKDKGFSARATGSFNVGPYHYTPTSDLPINNTSLAFHATIGAEAFGAHPNLNIDGFWSKQKLTTHSEKQVAFGYLHLTEGSENKNALLDYNSELNGRFKENTPHLPLAYGTYDLFSITGQGISGQFRAMRNEVGLFRPAVEKNESTGGQAGLELGAGLFSHVGGNVTVSHTNTKKTVWSASDNRLKEALSFTNKEAAYEAVFFKPTGELTALSPQLFQEIGDTDPIRIDNQSTGATLIAGNRFFKTKSTSGFAAAVYPNGLLQNESRVKRNQTISYLTVEEASKVGLDKKLKSYPINTLVYADCNNQGITQITRDNNNRPAHHISEIKVTPPSGSRYVYGLPVYNNQQKEVSFGIDAGDLLTGTNNSNSTDYGLVQYTPGTDNSIRNTKGEDHYFNATNIPPYAHSFLLTGVLSPDYMDKTGDGITEDDTGNAVKFNYHRQHTDYQWRIPIKANRAKYHEGFQSTFEDDKASYFYGKKEIWYVHSLESRTMLAQFYTSSRQDGLGVIGENGGKSTAATLQKLDSIQFFSKSDLKANNADAIPIKTIHFEYDYSLCPQIPNQVNTNNGKLTLKKVYFTYGKNQNGQLNTYSFNYQNNVAYNSNHYDRWGFFKKNPSTYPLNHQYPYVLQGAAAATTQSAAAAWSLHQIALPSGATIEVTYEADDYAYVQNKRAGQMMEVLGFVATNESPTADIYTTPTAIKKYIAVGLPLAVSSLAEAKKRYLEGIEQVYFDCAIQLDGQASNTERVQGYFTIDPSQNIVLQNTTTLLIPIKNLTDNKGRAVHPITFAALQKMRLDLPKLVYPGLGQTSAPIAIIKSMVGLINEIKNVFKGFEYHSMKKGWGKTVVLSQKASWVRLCNPDFKKLGGGSRVKQITINDDWGTVNGGNSIYGQTYDYTTTRTINGIQQSISSGVAAYEPGIGGEENLMKTPLPYDEKFFLAPKNRYYSETPIGEALFPAPMVGYSQVKVSDIANQTSLLDRTKSGHTLHHFFTAKDFPSIVQKTGVSPKRSRSNPILKFLKLDVKDGLSVSQGFTIELNDMHGKPRQQAIYDKNNALLSQTSYQYKVENADAPVKQLANEVSVLQPDGTVALANLGIEMDVWQEMLEETNTTQTLGGAANTDAFPITIFPAFTLTFFPIFQREKTTFRAAITTKLIKRSAILDQVTVTENGSTIRTNNLLFDSETGRVLLTKTVNEFDQEVYNFNYPAHWAYKSMGQAYQNIGSSFDNLVFTSGKFPNGFDVAAYFHRGDEVLIQYTTATQPENERYYIADFSNNNYSLIDKGGRPFDSNGTPVRIKIIRSGFRNQAATPIGQVSLLQTPIINNQLTFNSFSQVVAGNVTTFSQEAAIACEMIPEGNGFEVEVFVSDTLNPYLQGGLGNWRPNANYVFYNDRDPSTLTGGVVLENTGIVKNFMPFWTYFSSSWVENFSATNWTESNRISLYDWKGNELENMDALGIPSAAYFGYHKSLVTAVANNALYREIMAEGFEDYAFENTCNPSINFRRSLELFNPANQANDYQLAPDIAHTGRFSLKYGAGKQVEHTFRIASYCPFVSSFSENLLTTGCFTTVNGQFYRNECCACLPLLAPNHSKDYTLSLWVATDNSLQWGEAPAGGQIDIGFVVGGTFQGYNLQLLPTGPNINGWQRLEGTVNITPNASHAKLRLSNTGSGNLYFDDFRFHPFLSNMQTYVYDPFSERLMATLDEDNYASFYQYNDEGILILTKRETENGMVTVQEGQTVLKSQE